MRVSELYERVWNIRSQVNGFSVLLAAPDLTPGDDVDVLLSGIGWVEVADDAGEVRLYPASAVTEETSDQRVECVEHLLQQLPFDVSVTGDFRIVVELPLQRDGSGLIRKALTDVCEMHVGAEAQEVWLLVGPAQNFPTDQLPA